MSLNQARTFDERLDSYRAIAGPRICNTDRLTDGRKWTRFAAAAGASLATAATAEAAVTHVVPSSPIRLSVYYSDGTELNLDGVADVDLRVGAYYDVAYPSFNGYRYSGRAIGINGAVLIGDGTAGPFGDVVIKKLSNGDVIPAVAPAMAGQLLRMSATSSYDIASTAGQWGIDSTGFAGFVNGVGTSSLRAGWIKIRTEPAVVFGVNRLSTIVLLEWAYESVPGVSIMAGQTSAPIPGDYDGNTSVGPEDYALWRSTFGQTVAAGTGADGNSNARIDAADYAVWRNNVDIAGSGGVVPEPSTVTLGVLALGAAGIAALRRKRTA